MVVSRPRLAFYFLLLSAWNVHCTSTRNTVHWTVFIQTNKGGTAMNNLLRGGLAGAAAYKFGGGIISTILIFILVFWLLGKC